MSLYYNLFAKCLSTRRISLARYDPLPQKEKKEAGQMQERV